VIRAWKGNRVRGEQLREKLLARKRKHAIVHMKMRADYTIFYRARVR
jgi:hypothetical protein